MNNYLKEALEEIKKKSYQSWENSNVPYLIVNTKEVEKIMEIYDAKVKSFIEAEVSRKVEGKKDNY